MGALMAGFLLLQLGSIAKSSVDTSGGTQLASAATRGDESAASRGSRRTGEPSLAAQQIALASTTANLVSPADEPDPTTTTTVPPTTTTAKPTTTTAKPKPKPKPPVEATPSGDVNNNDVWARLAKCESGMRNDQGAPYYGYFQFTAGTWTSIGGSGLPTDHTYDEQLELAKKLQARSGWGQWPVCSKVALRG